MDRIFFPDSRFRAYAIGLVGVFWVAAAQAGQPLAPNPRAAALRVVSMNPSLTQMLVALGAASTLVGVDAYSARNEPIVRELPVVGGLFNPSLEAIVALEPDLVIVVPSIQQRDVRDRLSALEIEVLELPNLTLDQLLQSIEVLGARVGRLAAAQARVSEIRRVWAEISNAEAQTLRRSAVLVLTRDPLFVVGGGSYLNEMLRAAGLENVAAKFMDSYPRVSVEWLIAAAPQIIIDSVEDPLSAADHWARWPSIPAVAAGRVIEIPEGDLTLPGPYPDRALRGLVAAIHGAASLIEPLETGALP